MTLTAAPPDVDDATGLFAAAAADGDAVLAQVLLHQLRSPLLGLLLAAATASFFVGERSSALIIGVIVALSVGLGFVNEYRAEKAAQALHDEVRHEATVVRDGRVTAVLSEHPCQGWPERYRPTGRHTHTYGENDPAANGRTWPRDRPSA